MKKIIFVTLMMADNMNRRHFPVDGNSFIEYEGESYYAVNSVLAKTMTPQDDIKVILLHTEAGDKAGNKNANLFEDELNSLNTCGARIEYVHIGTDYVTSKDQTRQLYKMLLGHLEEDAELSADITFGPKSLPLLIFAAMQFGEKFFDCSIGNVIYQKIDFVAGKPVEGSQLICDYTPIYMLNSFTNTIECASSKKALSAIDAFLNN